MRVIAYRWVDSAEPTVSGTWQELGELSLFDIDPDMAVAWDRDMADVTVEAPSRSALPTLYLEMISSAIRSGNPDQWFPTRLYMGRGRSVTYRYWEGRWMRHRDVWRTFVRSATGSVTPSRPAARSARCASWASPDTRNTASGPPVPPGRTSRASVAGAGAWAGGRACVGRAGP
jgi:hypothetical protein